MTDLVTDLSQYYWMVIVGGIACATMGFGIGANDVANNVGSAIGSGALTFKWALILSAVFELGGAVGLGASVTDSVKGGILKPEFTENNPEVVMWSDLAALLTGTVWLVALSLLGMPVSTTHTTVGCLFGTGIALPNGVNIINWHYMVEIVISWLTSPLFSLILTMLLFTSYRALVLRKPFDKAYKWAKASLWPVMFITVSVFAIFFIFKTPVTSDWANKNIGVALGIGFGSGVIGMACLCPFFIWLSGKSLKKKQAVEAAGGLLDGDDGSFKSSIAAIPEHHGSYEDSSCYYSSSEEGHTGNGVVLNKVEHGELFHQSSDEVQPDCNDKVKRQWYKLPWFMDVKAVALGEDAHARKAADALERFHPSIENFFAYTQIITASLSCAVHGANDVANATAPFSGIYGIYSHGGFVAEATTDYWVLAVGGISIGFGVFFLGDRVIKSMGFKLAAMTPSRGFCVELSSTIVMVIGSFLGIPLSTTHCKVGGTIAVGLCEPDPNPTKWNLNGRISWRAVNGKFLLKILASWVGTIFVAGAMSAAVFSLGLYAPSISDVK